LTVLHIMGIGWSGSSALLDYLFYEGLIVGVNGENPSETRLFNKSAFPLNFILQYQNEFDYIDDICVASLITGGRINYSNSVVKEFLHEWFQGARPRGNQKNFHTLSDYEIFNTINNIFENPCRIRTKEFTKKYSELIKKLINLILSSSNKVMTFNQDPTFTNVEKTILFEESTQVVFFRDPKDIIAERLNLNHHNNRTLFFISLIKHIHKSYHKMLSLIIENKIIGVSFERFILDNEYRQNLISNLGFIVNNDSNENVINRSFDMGDSKKNIGVYPNTLTKLEIFLVNIFCKKIYNKLLNF